MTAGPGWRTLTRQLTRPAIITWIFFATYYLLNLDDYRYRVAVPLLSVVTLGATFYIFHVNLCLGTPDMGSVLAVTWCFDPLWFSVVAMLRILLATRRVAIRSVAQSYVPPRPTTSGGVGTRRQQRPVTNQDPFRASAAQTVEIELPVPGTSPQEIPPMLPGNNGSRRKSTQQDTRMPTHPAPEISESPPSTPTQCPQVSPGERLGEYTSIPLFHHVPSPDSSPHNTADYTYRFDTIPPPRPDSGPAHHEATGISEGIHAGVWPTYNKVSQEFDEKRLKQWNEDLDVLLIFAALFSAIVTAFLVRAVGDLEPNYQQQSALILHQLLNGHDPSLKDISDPTIPQKPASSAIAVNCLWFASLLTSLGASLCAMTCKGWLTEYSGGANPVVGLLRACKRHIRFMAFQRLNVHTLVAFLPALLHSSVLLFFAGAVVYLWRMDETVAIVFEIIGGVFGIGYFLLTILPFITNPPFRPYSTFFFYRPSVAVGKVVIQILDPFVHGYYLILRYVTSAILFPFARTVLSRGAIRRWYTQARTVLLGEYRRMRVWWVNMLNNPLDEIDTSQVIQEEAILWLSQVPLDPSESSAVVSSLALISASRPYRFEKPVIVFLNLVLEASFREVYGQEQTDAAIDCVLVLGHIKFQSAVDRDWDCDHNVGGIPVTALVAWAAQRFTIDAFQVKFRGPHSEGIRARLLTAAAWLSPVDGPEEVEWGGWELKIQDRSQFIEKIRMMLEQHVRSDNPLDNKVLINLIHGMHACIPRGDYGSASSIVPFLPLLCEDYDSPWSKDEAVLRALITYALDLLLPLAKRKPLVGREIEFDKLTSELIDALMTNTTHTDVVVFGFWLVHRVPYAFKPRKTILADITHIWILADEVIPEGHRERMNLHAVDAFIAVAQFHAVSNGILPKFTPDASLGLLRAALKYDSSRLTAAYAMAMILSLGTSTQAATFMNEIKVEAFIETLFSIHGDLERNAIEEDLIDLQIYSTLILCKFRPIELNAEKVRVLIGKMEKAIGDTITRNLGDFVDLDRVWWKVVYLSALLLRFLHEDEREEGTERFRTRVRTLVRNGELSLADDYERCLEPLGMGALELEWKIREQRKPVYSVFEAWIGEFPLSPLVGSVTSTDA